ncbi:pseudouridine synthase [Candidatus Peregrinibacteria bacterium CG22_combo_CG10-13_8_21_14_all_44_10]|nr:MAG: hypothetical protein AUK45_04075 [Candidatus Peregrinibacteria bacterium CG2_30_44_17]PIP66188.1 MAG: pseudouridine synthase [Candidatus Peregrinibacteria bacterium CG22_combo_CG10-13_8_21_14_all_44_10]PIS04500.1 MAG: pseudouridine synthase [Candidatus Peregrinibacteria bacterium CG10_big_fil_rev_8_21_14_0_10_44_7]PIX80010.1 MAG: pseudouridine synthase [Candidatus Peregrinibacteria bacterium CG_4_10_14_3_um_filter_44_21]PJB88964.1 MAG: pseudouridine synthase [Candidatus Peregrinibacteri
MQDSTIGSQNRVQKIIANSGYCSRRKAETLIVEGKVFVNGEKAILGQKVSENDKIEVAGKVIKKQKHIYIALNKPAGYISTTADTHKRQTVLNLLPKELHSAKPAGRLDMDSDGLMVMSTDGEFINHLTHPKFPHHKVYNVTLKGQIQKSQLEELTSGKLELEGYELNPMTYELLDENESYTKLKITLSEGRKRQIREVFKILGFHVVYLRRIQIGPIKLGALKKGEFRHLTETEIKKVLAC